jgi:Radical SAM superfamily
VKLNLPGSTDSVVFISTPTIVCEQSIFLYAHQLYTEGFLARRLVGWLSLKCPDIRHIHCIEEDGSQPCPLGTFPSGPGSKRSKDLNAYRFGLSESSLAAKISEGSTPTQVWISAMFPYDGDCAKLVIETAREVAPNAEIVLGGGYASLVPKEASRLGADIIHQGLIEGADEKAGVRTRYSGLVVLGRGCPNACSFCAFKLVENVKPTPGDPMNIIGEIDKMITEGMSLVKLYSPAAFKGAHIQVNEAVLKELASRDVTTLLWTGVEPTAMTPQRARLLKDANAIDLMIPLQTVDESLARSWNRKNSLAKYMAAKDCLLDAGYDPLEVSSDVLMGHPDHPLEDSIRTACFVWSLGLTPLVFPFTCVPGAVENGPEDLSPTQYQPYLWPFARPEYTAQDYIEFSKLSRILPNLLDHALTYIDPDTIVLPLIEKYLNEFNFDIPQWKIDAPLPPLHQGYQTFLSHPWELITMLLTSGHVEAALPFVDICDRVAVCEPAYMTAVRLMERAGYRSEAVKLMKRAMNWLPSKWRTPVREILGRDENSPELFNDAASYVFEALQWQEKTAEATAWQNTKWIEGR